MTPQEFLKDYNLNPLSPVHAEIVFVFMKNYAKLMCQKQKEICAEEAKGCKYGFYEDLALNSPFPEELQDEN